MRRLLLLFCVLGTGLMAEPAIVLQVRVGAQTGDLARAKQTLAAYKKTVGQTPEYLEAFSWIARGELRAKQYEQAETTAAEVRKLVLARVGKGRLDSNPSYATALGASIEVQGLAAAATGRRDQAVAFLRDEASRWKSTSIWARVQKNFNLLSLEGKPAPPLVTSTPLTSRKAEPLSSKLGHPVLLFFWAHWCADCKNEVAVVARAAKAYQSRGLEVVAPTQHYGYVEGGEDAPRPVETAYMKTIYKQFYAPLGDVEVPVSEESFGQYGVSTTPTLVLVDAKGTVRLYNPGAMTYEQLAAKIEPLLTR
ncbi:MAG: Redoxin domain protein [Bryobacterales bacterium]|nr:Redoxin domain protein [Bryobacterales bacterium]